MGETKMLNYFKTLLNMILNRKTIDLDNDGKIETLREEIQGVFSEFRNMNDKLENVNSELADIIVDEEQEQLREQERLERLIRESNERISASAVRAGTASQEIEANRKLQDKVSEFLPNKG